VLDGRLEHAGIDALERLAQRLASRRGLDELRLADDQRGALQAMQQPLGAGRDDAARDPRGRLDLADQPAQLVERAAGFVEEDLARLVVSVGPRRRGRLGRARERRALAQRELDQILDAATELVDGRPGDPLRARAVEPRV
jgi:hypothetical protein